MRVVRESSKEGIRISLFEWNNKFILKFEAGNLEQTYKVPAMDVLEEKDLDTLMEGDFYQEVKKRFDEMHQSLQNATKNF
ncbi:hypothetical protein [Cyclobacterium qasimii]|uniref:Uncharacterized protein n=2 Tax=Cyclobacterium qasimii TaxID=1350429 RepID=S7WUW7_9BACT|nr:hypothetical protein [Cyclobacterium qasimii]EPR70539.1 hypothetical protein ADICYQ_0963 [Cyclobacterium qasimii M12-11B]GEO22279.1 hypothetical protein CQA01_28130 [Cyclobacterium qasimii]